jgi:hypothetical protein
VIPGFPRVRTRRAHPRPRRARRNAGRRPGIPATPNTRRTPLSRPRCGPLPRSPVPARVRKTANCPSLDTRRVAATPTGPRPDRATAPRGRHPTVPGRPVTLGPAPDHGPGGRAPLPQQRAPRYHRSRPKRHPWRRPDAARSSSDQALSRFPGFQSFITGAHSRTPSDRYQPLAPNFPGVPWWATQGDRNRVLRERRRHSDQHLRGQDRAGISGNSRPDGTQF